MPQRRPDAHGNHVLPQLLAQPDTGVEAFGDDVAQPVVDQDLHPGAGMRRKKAGQHGADHRLKGVTRGGQAHRARNQAALAAQLIQRAADLRQRRLQRTQQPLPGHRRRHAAAVALQEADAETCLKPFDRVAQRRRGHPQSSRGAGEAVGTRHGGKGRKVIKAASTHHPTLLNEPSRL